MYYIDISRSSDVCFFTDDLPPRPLPKSEQTAAETGFVGLCLLQTEVYSPVEIIYRKLYILIRAAPEAISHAQRVEHHSVKRLPDISKISLGLSQIAIGLTIVLRGSETILKQYAELCRSLP